MRHENEMERISALHDPKSFVLPRSGVVFGLAARETAERRILLASGVLRRASSPQRETYSFYVPDFFLAAPQPWLVPQSSADPHAVQELRMPELLSLIASSGLPDTQTPKLQWTPPSLARFQESFQDLQANFASGRLAKAVPVCFEHAPAAPADVLTKRRLSALLRVPDSLTPYGFWTEDGGILGASPEVLFEVQDGILKTMALAGTLAAPPDSAAPDAEQMFLSDPKERREHCLVIDGIVEALAAFGTVKVGATRILKLPTLWHLQTPIEVALKETPSFEALARSLHPTPALGGAPHDAAFAWLRKQDRENAPAGRGRFGAPFGVQCPDGSAVCLVAVRNVLWNNDTARIGAGCGIIRESVLEREWEELRFKRDSVKRLLDL